MASLQPFTDSAIAPATLKRWTVETYHRMSELGILDPQERTELIAGQITVMDAKGTPHVNALRLLTRELDKFLADRPFASTQDPIALDDLSEPEPDLAVIKGSILDYTGRHPRTQDVALVIEVADSTLKYDSQVKDKIYAGAGIVEYWVQDLQNQRLHIFREPQPTGYASHQVLSLPKQISPLAFPDLTLTLGSIFPPA